MAKTQQPVTKKHPLERKTEAGKAEGIKTLFVISTLLLLLSIILWNPVFILASAINLFVMAIVASCLQRSENMETCLNDIRDALNLQTIRLEIISRQLMDGSDMRKAAAQIGELKDIAEEAGYQLGELKDIADETRDMIAFLQPEKEIEEG